MSDTPQPKCQTCRHFVADQMWPDTTPGACRRFPPVLVFDQREAKLKTVFPSLWPAAHCGEHAPIQPIED